jgi:hypothetical protein
MHMKATHQTRLEISMPRVLAISAALGLALTTGLATAGYAVAAPSALHTATKTTTVQSGPITFGGDHGGWDDDWDDFGGDCNGTGNICA